MSERRGDAELLCEATDGIATVTISNPAKRNAMTAAMWSAFPALLDELAVDGAVRVVILRGAGDTFCAGADLDGLSELLSGAGPRAPAIAWKNNNWQLTVGSRSLTKSKLRVSPGVTYAFGMRRHTVGWPSRFGP